MGGGKCELRIHSIIYALYLLSAISRSLLLHHHCDKINSIHIYTYSETHMYKNDGYFFFVFSQF